LLPRRGESENCAKVRQRMRKLLQCRVVGGGQDCCVEGENARKIAQKEASACANLSQRMRKLMQCSEVGRGHYCCLERENARRIVQK
jgi:hypothetical protein